MKLNWPQLHICNSISLCLIFEKAEFKGAALHITFYRKYFIFKKESLTTQFAKNTVNAPLSTGSVYLYLQIKTFKNIYTLQTCLYKKLIFLHNCNFSYSTSLSECKH